MENRLRIGIASFVIGFALLTGTPIAGALVEEHGKYVWYRPLVFASVGVPFQFHFISFQFFLTVCFQVVVLSGAAMFVVSRSMLAKRKGTMRV